MTRRTRVGVKYTGKKGAGHITAFFLSVSRVLQTRVLCLSAFCMCYSQLFVHNTFTLIVQYLNQPILFIL